MNINEIKSDIQMKNFYFLECSVMRNEVIEPGSLSVDLQKKVSKISDGGYSVVLTLNVNKEKGDLNVKVVAAATFYCQNTDESFVDSIMETNTVAIMFPYIRSQVSLLTTQPGMTPIVLPPINTAKLN